MHASMDPVHGGLRACVLRANGTRPGSLDHCRAGARWITAALVHGKCMHCSIFKCNGKAQEGCGTCYWPPQLKRSILYCLPDSLVRIHASLACCLAMAATTFKSGESGFALRTSTCDLAQLRQVVHAREAGEGCWCHETGAACMAEPDRSTSD